MHKLLNNIWTKCLIGYITILFIAGIACVCYAVLTIPPEYETNWIRFFNRLFTSGLIYSFKISIVIDIALNISLFLIFRIRYRFFAPATMIVLGCMLSSIIFVFMMIGIASISALAGSFASQATALLIITLSVLGIIFLVSSYRLFNSTLQKWGKP